MYCCNHVSVAFCQLCFTRINEWNEWIQMRRWRRRHWRNWGLGRGGCPIFIVRFEDIVYATGVCGQCVYEHVANEPWRHNYAWPMERHLVASRWPASRTSSVQNTGNGYVQYRLYARFSSLQVSPTSGGGVEYATVTVRSMSFCLTVSKITQKVTDRSGPNCRGLIDFGFLWKWLYFERSTPKERTFPNDHSF